MHVVDFRFHIFSEPVVQVVSNEISLEIKYAKIYNDGYDVLTI